VSVKALVPNEWSERRCICRSLDVGSRATLAGRLPGHLVEAIGIPSVSFCPVRRVTECVQVVHLSRPGSVDCFNVCRRLRLSAAPSEFGRRRRVVPSSCTPAPSAGSRARLLHGHALLQKGFFASPAPSGRLDSPVARRRSAEPESNLAWFKP
jgi:hypothetical protein